MTKVMTAGGGTHGSGEKDLRRGGGDGDERAAAERKAREVKAMMTNGWRGAEECVAAEQKGRNKDAVAMKERWEVEERRAAE